MKIVVKFCLAFAGLVVLGAAPQPQSAIRKRHSCAARRPVIRRSKPIRPIRAERARLAFLTPKRLSANSMAADTSGEAGATRSAYSVIDLNAFVKSSGVTIDPLALNNAGQMVGDSSDQGYIINPSGSNGPLGSFGYAYYFYFTD